jgi:uncharacterized protein YggE
MSDVIITVRGEHELRIAPERATVHLTLAFDGADRAQVVERTLAAASPVREGIEAQKAAGSVVEWSSERMGVFSDRPWNSEGRQLAPVHRASVDFTATFADISAMSEWVAEASGEDGVSIGYIDWHLTPQTEAEVEREVAAQAVGVAVARARAYAEALGLHNVTPLEIADRGLISAGVPPQAKAAMRAGAAFDMESAGGLELQGEEITVSVTVEGRFAAN